MQKCLKYYKTSIQILLILEFSIYNSEYNVNFMYQHLYTDVWSTLCAEKLAI